MTQGTGRDASAILTVPNALSLARILLIPVLVVLLLRRGSEVAGLALLVGLSASDWLDGYVARRTGRVTELGKMLDPTADRLVLAAALVALVIRGALPPWVALLVVGRDALVVGAGAALLAVRGVRVEVRAAGKAATLLLMTAVPLMAWGGLGLTRGELLGALGWTLFAAGALLSYGVTAWYAADLRSAWRVSRPGEAEDAADMIRREDGA